MGPIKEILAEAQFQEELTTSSQARLVVVDFTASWCGPCQTIAPFYEQLSRKYPNAVFLKVDVDKCQETAVSQRVSVMPTFHFYRNKVKVDSIQGADRQKLEEKILKYYEEGTGENDVGVAGHKKEDKLKKEATSEGIAGGSSTTGASNPELRAGCSLKATGSSRNFQVKEAPSVIIYPSADSAHMNVFSRPTTGLNATSCSLKIAGSVTDCSKINTSKNVVKPTSKMNIGPEMKSTVSGELKRVLSEREDSATRKNPSTIQSKETPNPPPEPQ